MCGFEYSPPATRTLRRNEKQRLWLEHLQKTLKAWQLADDLLHQPEGIGLEGYYFGAQTLRTKIQYDFLELPREAQGSLRDSLFSHLAKFRLGTIGDINAAGSGRS